MKRTQVDAYLAKTEAERQEIKTLALDVLNSLLNEPGMTERMTDRAQVVMHLIDPNDYEDERAAMAAAQQLIDDDEVPTDEDEV